MRVHGGWGAGGTTGAGERALRRTAERRGVTQQTRADHNTLPTPTATAPKCDRVNVAGKGDDGVIKYKRTLAADNRVQRIRPPQIRLSIQRLSLYLPIRGIRF